MNDKCYKSSLFLPKTELKINVSLEKYKEILAFWKTIEVYKTFNQKNKNQSKKIFLLHEGPTYSNGNIHLGHILNHIIKDVFVRYYAINNFRISYILGWDTHGLPIEDKIVKKNPNLNLEKKNINYFRNLCKKFAIEQSEQQKEDLQQIGLLCDNESRYLTLDKEYVLEQISIFKKLVNKNFIYSDYKPLFWSCVYKTALADNEIEYLNKEDYSLFFLVKVDSFLDDVSIKKYIGNYSLFFLIWTTQPWTITSNKLIAIKQNLEYCLIWVKKDKIFIIVSKKSIYLIKEKYNEEYEIISTFLGIKLLNWTYSIEDCNYKGKVVDGSFFINESEGTGFVHLAPAFGSDDYLVAKSIGNIEIELNIDEGGYFNEKVINKKWVGKHYSVVNEEILLDLKEKKVIFKLDKFIHSYPHDWRDKKPVIFLLTKQVFIDVSKLKDKMVNLCNKIEWKPKWAEKEMKNIIEKNINWCISRQRHWGVPIPILVDNKEYIINEQIIEFVYEYIKENGVESWFNFSILDKIKEKFSNLLSKEATLLTDIMDVWFDSGVSNLVVLKSNYLGIKDVEWPSSLIVEGQDQFRGWFKSSLVISSALDSEIPPFKKVVTHGFVTDEKGIKLSKSLGNYISAEQLFKTYSMDVIRLWVISSDFTKEICFGKTIIKSVQEAYQKIRNTLRFLLGNLQHIENIELLEEEHTKNVFSNNVVDRIIIKKLDIILEESVNNISNASFNKTYLSILDYCINWLSSFYFDINKDCLYCELLENTRKKEILSTFYIIFKKLIRLIFPFTPFLAEECFLTLKNNKINLFKNSLSVIDLLNNEKNTKVTNITEEEEFLFKFLYNLRKDCYKELEIARKDNKIKSNSQADVEIYTNKYTFDILNNKNIKNSLEYNKFLLISSLKIIQKEFSEKENQIFYNFNITKTNNLKCNRCQRFEIINIQDLEYKKLEDNSLCKRCFFILSIN